MVIVKLMCCSRKIFPSRLASLALTRATLGPTGCHNPKHGCLIRLRPADALRRHDRDQIEMIPRSLDPRSSWEDSGPPIAEVGFRQWLAVASRIGLLRAGALPQLHVRPINNVRDPSCGEFRASSCCTIHLGGLFISLWTLPASPLTHSMAAKQRYVKAGETLHIHSPMSPISPRRPSAGQGSNVLVVAVLEAGRGSA